MDQATHMTSHASWSSTPSHNPTSPSSSAVLPEWDLHPEVLARPYDLCIEKNLPGSFTGTALESWLRQQAIDTVVIAGYMTHMCCDTTARQAVHRGFTVEFLSDATGTLPLKEDPAGEVNAEELQRAILCAQQMLLSEVISTDVWCRQDTR